MQSSAFPSLSAPWADDALRSMEPKMKASRADVQPAILLLRGIPVAWLGEDPSPLLDPRRRLLNCVVELAQIALGHLQLGAALMGDMRL